MAQQVLMPRLSQDMTQGRIVEWLKKEGEAVKEGEPLVSVESDKAEVELQAPQSAILRRVLVGAGEETDVGTPLAILAGADENIEELLVKALKEAPRPVAAPPPSHRARPPALLRPLPPASVSRFLRRRGGLRGNWAWRYRTWWGPGPAMTRLGTP